MMVRDELRAKGVREGCPAGVRNPGTWMAPGLATWNLDGYRNGDHYDARADGLSSRGDALDSPRLSSFGGVRYRFLMRLRSIAG